ncbi:hypothetical protein BX266_7236 [Streptomyces sp. TLI_171]|nr:hypothetical protein BX266_7236 [Streptomyces sp. TLI_171]
MALGGTEERAQAAYDDLDRNNDYWLSAKEIHTAFREFLTSDDPRSIAGGFILGVLREA